VDLGGEHREYHQCKRQHGLEDKWTVTALSAVLRAAQERLERANSERANSRFLFVSTVPCQKLKELCERAADVPDEPEVFFRNLFPTNERLEKCFRDFCTVLNLNPDSQQDKLSAHDLLSGMDFRTFPHPELVADNEAWLGCLISGTPSSAHSLLADYAVRNLHCKVTAQDLWDHLRKDDRSRLAYAQDPDVQECIRELKSTFNDSIGRRLIEGSIIRRPETEKVLDELHDEAGAGIVLLTGEAGCGKSSVLLETSRALEEAGVPWIPFRFDRQTPETSPVGFGKACGLPDSPGRVLANLCEGQSGVLVLDQLDAVRWTGAHSVSSLECCLSLIRQVARYPNLRVVAACRTFDLETDPELNAWKRNKDESIKEIEVGLLEEDVAREHVARWVGSESKLSDAQVQLLRNPLHLSLFSELDTSEAQYGFQTAIQLFDAFWDRKRQQFRDMGQPDGEWLPTLHALLDASAERGTLEVPTAVLDEHDRAVRALCSLGIFVETSRGISFFHQTFRDYVFARRFCARNESIIAWLGENEQSLAIREQARVILSYLRGVDPDNYLASLRELLDSDAIRYHIKQLSLQLLGSAPDPIWGEWEIVRDLLDKEDWRDHVVGEVLAGHAPWFDLLHGQGLWEEWLADASDAWRKSVVRLLWQAHFRRPEPVADILQPYIGEPPPWPDHLRSFLHMATPHSNRRQFDLLLRCLRGGLLDGKICHWLGKLADHQPVWAAEFLGAWLRRASQILSSKSKKARPGRRFRSLVEQKLQPQSIVDTAEAAPVEYLNAVIPGIELVGRECLREKQNFGFLQDMAWQWGSLLRGDSPQIAPSIGFLAGAEAVLRKLGRADPDRLRYRIEHVSGSDLEVFQFLTMRALTQTPDVMPDVAVDLILSDPRRLEIREMSDPWTARDLIKAASARCSGERIEKLSEFLLSYERPRVAEMAKCDMHTFSNHPVREKVHCRDPNCVGERQYFFLSAIPPERRSDQVAARVAELRRKYGDFPPERPASSEMHRVESPIDRHNVDHMTPEQWIGAMREYADDSDHRKPGEKRLRGGVIELSRELKRCAHLNGEAFARLALDMPLDLNPRYFSAIVDGLLQPEPYKPEDGEKVELGPPAQLKQLVQIIQRTHELPGWPCAQEVSHGLRRCAERPWPESILAIVSQYAQEHPDPEEELWQVCPGSNGTPYYGGDMYNFGINTARGAAAWATGALLSADNDRASALEPAVDSIPNDPSPAVRSCAAMCCVVWLNIDRDEATDLFLDLAAAQEDRLLGTSEVLRFMSFATQTHFSKLRPVLVRMIDSEVDEASEAGAYIAWRERLRRGNAVELAEECLTGAVAQRTGSAKAIAALFDEEEHRADCEPLLRELLDDPEKEVREGALTVFWKGETDDIGQMRGLIPAAIQTPEGAKRVVDALERSSSSLLPLSDQIFQLAEMFTTTLAEEARSVQRSLFFEARSIGKIVLRLYEQAEGDNNADLRRGCLDVIDSMMQKGVGDVSEAVAKLAP
jgi:hypothetical protein